MACDRSPPCVPVFGFFLNCGAAQQHHAVALETQLAKALFYGAFRGLDVGDPGMTRTCDLRFRKPSLYPAELRDREPGRSTGIANSIPERPRNRYPGWA